MESKKKTKIKESLIRLKLNKDWIKTKTWFIALLLALSVFVLLRSFVFIVFVVNNNDMRSSYAKGDVLFISQITTDFNVSDVLLLDYPLKDSVASGTLFIQRLVAKPGDSLELRDKHVYVNGKQLEEPEGLQYNYFIKSDGRELDSTWTERLQLYEGGKVSDEFDYSYSLTKKQKALLECDSLIKRVELKTELKNRFDENCFPGSPHCNWNADQYGMIYIPKKDDVLLIDTTNIALYQSIIVEYEKNNLEIRSDSIFINGALHKTYSVKQNYYFVLGDNRDNANDSRVWGFLPECSIKGKVIATLKHSRK